jgi:dTDP-4-dehydrorhamnose reductase
MQKILIFGRVGQVGWELRHKLACLGEIVSVDYPEVDFTKPDTLRAVVRAEQPTVIVNAAAYTAVDKAETEPELAMAINGAGPAVLAAEAQDLGSLLVHYSTDYVFSGGGTRPWLESDTPAPLNVYGKTKLAGDEAIQASGCDHLIFRTSWVYGSRGSNFLLTMLRLAGERNALSIVDDQVGAPTTSECIAQATACVLAQVLSPAGKGIAGRSGVYNLTNGGEASWFGFAQSLLTRANATLGTPLPHLKPIATSDFPRPAPRPGNSRLSGQKLEEVFGLNMPQWEMALSLVLETMAEFPSPIAPNA